MLLIVSNAPMLRPRAGGRALLREPEEAIRATGMRNPMRRPDRSREPAMRCSRNPQRRPRMARVQRRRPKLRRPLMITVET